MHAEPSLDPRLLVSVAVSTYQRASKVTRLLDALELQTLDPNSFEVVVVDNGSTDETRQVLADRAEGRALQLRVTRCEVNRGPSRGRNAAWRSTRAPVVAFTDDDCLPHPQWLERGLAELRPGEFLVGRTEPDPEQRRLLGAFSRTVWPSFARFFPTSNILYWRDDLVSIGGFDEAFLTPGGEDTDVGWRVKKLGRRVRSSDDVIVYHDVRPSSLRATLRETLRWIDVPRLVAKHPDIRNDFLHARYFWKRTHPPALLAAVGILLAIPLPPALLLMLPWIRVRMRRRPGARSLAHRVISLPGHLAVDLLEVFVMLKGSIRHRALVL